MVASLALKKTYSPEQSSSESDEWDEWDGWDELDDFYDS